MSNKILFCLLGVWGNLKMRISSSRGLYSSRLPEFLHEFSYRHLYAINGNIFDRLVADIQLM